MVTRTRTSSLDAVGGVACSTRRSRGACRTAAFTQSSIRADDSAPEQACAESPKSELLSANEYESDGERDRGPREPRSLCRGAIASDLASGLCHHATAPDADARGRSAHRKGGGGRRYRVRRCPRRVRARRSAAMAAAPARSRGAAETGVVGLAAWVALYAVVLARLLRSRAAPGTHSMPGVASAAMVGVLFLGGVHVDFTHVKLVWAFLGLALATCDESGVHPGPISGQLRW